MSCCSLPRRKQPRQMADQQLLRLVDGHADARAQLQRRFVARVVALWAAFDGWYDEALVAEAASETGQIVGRGQTGTAQLIDAYLAKAATIVGLPAVTVGADKSMSQTLRLGVGGFAEVYSRIGAEYRRYIALGADPQTALQRALLRAQEMTATDLGLANREQGRRTLRAQGCDTYRRVVRSERSCGLCVLAATRTYYTSSLMPIHARCRCGILPAPRGFVPFIDDELLGIDTYDDITKTAGSNSAADLKRVRVTVVHHGELGPQLRDANHSFRGPEQVAA